MTDTGEADCWNENDVLSIELGVGCKFNCSFCTTPFKKTDTLFANCRQFGLYTKYSIRKIWSNTF